MAYRAWMEIALVILTGVTHLICESLFSAKLPFIIVASAIWTTYVVRQCYSDPNLLKQWGLRRDNMRSSLLLTLPFFILGATLIVIYGWSHHQLRIPTSFLYIALLYPLWGLVQQFLVQAMITRNLVLLGWSRWAVTLIAAVLFSVVHWPDTPLMILTFVGGLVWTTIYLNVPNLIPLGISHGLLGALVYYLVLGRDPWMELFGR